MQSSPHVPDIGSDQRVLIVDDDPHVASFLRRLLSSEGFDCDVAHGVVGAWQCLDANDYSLLVTDIQMPDGNGLDLLERVKSRFGDEIAVVMVTGVGERDVGIRAVNLGAYSYLIKPFEPNEAIIHVVNALRRRELTLQENRFQEELRNRVKEAQEEIGWRLLSAVGWRDIETGSHIRRVGRSAEALGGLLGWDADRLASLQLAAAMHDVGKIAVPDSVLLKPGPLTGPEFLMIQQHTVAGAEMLRGSDNPLLHLAEKIARSHHERWDGKGYPDGLAGTDIPQAARIVTVVDVYDALTTDRPYRAAYDQERALEIMLRDRGRHFDPEILDLFVELLPDLRFDDLPEDSPWAELGFGSGGGSEGAASGKRMGPLRAGRARDTSSNRSSG